MHKLKILVISFAIFLAFFVSIATIGKHYSQSLCDQNGYYCVKVKKGETWVKLWPDEQQRKVVMRVNRMTTQLYAGLTLAVPESANSHMDVSPFESTIEPSPRSRLIVDLSRQAFGAYDNAGYLVHWGPISGGKGYCPDVGRRCATPRGTFYIYTKSGQNCVSTKFPIPRGGAPMPFCMFFYRGFALHGGDLPGYNASHGCVRMFKEDAEWLNKNFIDMGRLGTKVIVQ